MYYWTLFQHLFCVESIPRQLQRNNNTQTFSFSLSLSLSFFACPRWLYTRQTNTSRLLSLSQKPFFLSPSLQQKFSEVWYLSVYFLHSATNFTLVMKHFKASLSLSLKSNSQKCDIWLEFWTLKYSLTYTQHTNCIALKSQALVTFDS